MHHGNAIGKPLVDFGHRGSDSVVQRISSMITNASENYRQLSDVFLRGSHALFHRLNSQRKRTVNTAIFVMGVHRLLFELLHHTVQVFDEAALFRHLHHQPLQRYTCGCNGGSILLTRMQLISHDEVQILQRGCLSIQLRYKVSHLSETHDGVLRWRHVRLSVGEPDFGRLQLPGTRTCPQHVHTGLSDQSPPEHTVPLKKDPAKGIGVRRTHCAPHPLTSHAPGEQHEPTGADDEPTVCPACQHTGPRTKNFP
mmetsp:Transcript_52962/g.141544  ORF Transcript_52962/g.141544 Transcript_52962/m.141544 type:complete len:254 (-) Transcript_52962:1755-2516(-)